MDWEFLTNGRFWVIAVVLLCVGAVLGLAFSGNLPEVINLTEDQRQDIVAKQERLCSKEVRDLKKSFDSAMDRCFDKNRDLIDALEENTETIKELDQDLNQAIYDFGQDFNQAIYDLDCD